MAAVLIVEDSHSQALSLRHVLERHGYSVSVASTGLEAIALINNKKPDIILSDIAMPEMDGFKLCRFLKDDKNLRDIPVILITELKDPKDIFRGIEAGADHYVIKPYDEGHLVSRIESALGTVLSDRSTQKEEVLEITYSGEKFSINASLQQVMGLLLSTCESAVTQRYELMKVREELRTINREIEDRVREKTSVLEAEVEKRRQAEEALRKSERLYRLITEGTTDLIAVTTFDVNPTYTYISPSHRSLGYEPDELIGKSGLNFVHPEDRKNLLPILKRHLASKIKKYLFNSNTEVHEFLRFRVKDKSGNWRFLESTVNIIGEELLFVSKDVTERRMTEEEMKKHNEDD